MSANMYNFLRAFHTFLYKTGGHVYRNFVVKPRAYCRLVTGIVVDGTLVILVLIALFSSLSRWGLGTRIEGLWKHNIYELVRIFLIGLFENKEILNGSQNDVKYI